MMKHKLYLISRVVKSESGCWEWQGSRNQKGYGKMGYGGRGGKTWLAHRFAYTYFIGEIPKGKLIMHHCDNPCCCNPYHLSVGTHKDNMDDMISKGRDHFVNPCYGKANGAKRFTLIAPDDLLVEVLNMAKFCRDNKLTRSCIGYVLSGKSKQHKGWRAYEET